MLEEGSLHTQRSWTVLLLGGSSGSGKTTIAERLGLALGVPWAQVDDFRLALQRTTTPEQQPALHFFVDETGAAREGIWALPPQTLRDGLISVASVVSSALQEVVGHHVATRKPLIIEGDGIHPAFAAQYAGDTPGGSPIRAVFLVEDDEEILLANMVGRGRGGVGPAAVQRTQARMNALYGKWLADEARRQGLSVLPPRPYDTLLKHSLNGFHRQEQPELLIFETLEVVAFIERASRIVLCIYDPASDPISACRLRYKASNKSFFPRPWP